MSSTFHLCRAMASVVVACAFGCGPTHDTADTDTVDGAVDSDDAAGLVGPCSSHDPDRVFEETGYSRACSPRAGHEDENYRCCSNDPAAVNGVALFSGDNNDESAWGQCVDRSASGGLSNGCPVPCDPGGTVAEIESVCGSTSANMCCQTTPLQPRDCIFDPVIGDGGCFRPVRGFDATQGGPGFCPVDDVRARLEAVGHDPELARCYTDWEFDTHVTHQDPGVPNADRSCVQLADSAGFVYFACYEAIGVADARGFCVAKTMDFQVCPSALTPQERITLGIPLDACTQLNIDAAFTGCF